MIINNIQGINKYLFFYYYLDEEIKKKLLHDKNQIVKNWIKKYMPVLAGSRLY